MLQMVLDGAEQSGHDLQLVFFEPGPWPQELARAGFQVDVLAVGRLRQWWRLAAAIARLSRLLRRSRPELIFNWSAKTQIYGASAAILAGMSDRVLWWQQVIPDGHWLDRLATALPARAVVCYSGAAARAQAGLRPSRPTVIVAAGSPMPEAASASSSGSGSGSTASAAAAVASLALPAKIPVVGLVGRLQRWKGQDRLLRAQAILRERGLPLHVLIVGGDSYGLEPDYAASLSQLIDGLGSAGSVTLTGEVPDAGPYIERMDVLVNASDPEPFGIVLLEGMARGVAVAAVDSGGPAEFVEHGRTGVLARSGEPEDLADALEPLLRSPELRWRIGAAGRERFVADFTDEAMRRRLFAELERIAAAR